MQKKGLETKFENAHRVHVCLLLQVLIKPLEGFIRVKAVMQNDLLDKLADTIVRGIEKASQAAVKALRGARDKVDGYVRLCLMASLVGCPYSMFLFWRVFLHAMYPHIPSVREIA